MERLTIRNSDGSVSQPTDSTFEKVFNKLAEYEDIGLEPYEVKRLKTCSPDDFSIGLVFEQYRDRLNKLQRNSESEYSEQEETLVLFSAAMRLLFKDGIADVFTVDNFIRSVERGSFNDYDGIGCFSAIDGEKQKEIRCDADWLKENRADYPFVLWYNK